MERQRVASAVVFSLGFCPPFAINTHVKLYSRELMYRWMARSFALGGSEAKGKGSVRDGRLRRSEVQGANQLELSSQRTGLGKVG